MWSAISTNLKLILAFLVILLFVLFAGYVYITLLKGNQQRALDSQKQQITEECKKAQITTKGADDAIIQNLQHTLNQCRNLNSVPAKCVPIKTSTPQLSGTQSRHDDTGLNARWLKLYQDECIAIQSDYHTCVAFAEECAK